MSREHGFTLLELMATITVLGVLLAMAIPSFQEMIERNKVTSAANNLLSSILLARSEAIKREQTISVAKGSTWKKWRLFVDTNGNKSLDNGEEVIAEFNSSNSITASGAGEMADAFSFNSRGRVTATLDSGDKFTFTQGSHSRYICFSSTGRPRVQKGDCT